MNFKKINYEDPRLYQEIFLNKSFYFPINFFKWDNIKWKCIQEPMVICLN